jgi:hypothetical protein
MVILLSLCWAHQPVFATVDSLRMTLLTPRNEKGLNDPLPQGDFDVLAIPLKRVQNWSQYRLSERQFHIRHWSAEIGAQQNLFLYRQTRTG